MKNNILNFTFEWNRDFLKIISTNEKSLYFIKFKTTLELYFTELYRTEERIGGK